MDASLSLLSAFSAGLLSFLSPCVLPLVPGYLSYVSGISMEELRDETQAKELVPILVWNTLWFILGFTVVFTILGATATFVGQALLKNSIWLTRIGGAIVFVFGLHMTHIIQIPILNRITQFDAAKETAGPISAFLLGASFSLGWTPCIGPILTSILALASQQETAGQGMALLATYSAGLGVPFLLTGILIGSFFGWYQNFRRHLGTIEKISGILLMALGLLLMSNKFSVLAIYLQNTLG